MNHDKNIDEQYKALLREANIRELARRQSAMTDTATVQRLLGQQNSGQADGRNGLPVEADMRIDPTRYRNTKRVKPKSCVTTDRLYMAALTIIVVLHLINDGWFL